MPTGDFGPMPEQWQERCAVRMTGLLARQPRRGKTRAYLAAMPKRPPIVVSPTDFPIVSRAEARLDEVRQIIRDAQRYADWEARGKPPSPTLPRRDRLRPSARRGRDGIREKLFAAQCGNCGLCGYAIGDAFRGTIDHVVPRRLGGKNAGNMLLAHERCNNEKADRPPTQSEIDLLAAVNAILAIVDTHPTGGDVKQAPAPLSGDGA